jgi:sodium/bile acid cotransporter 7
VKAFLIQRWFLLALAGVMAAGFASVRVVGLADTVSAWAESAPMRNSVVATVMFLMALPLEARAMWRTIRRPGPPALAVGMNYLAVPLLMWLFVRWVGGYWLSNDMALGMLVVATVPCTLASAAVWTRRAGGNDAVSIMVTVVTNATCFLVTPFWLLQLTGRSSTFDPRQIVITLAVVVVLPMVIAQLLRLVRPIGWWATRQTTRLGVSAQFGVLAVIFFGTVQTARRLEASAGRPILVELLVVLVGVTGIHVAILLAGLIAARACRMSRPDQIAVGIAGSQKTLMVGIQVCMELGFNIVPMIGYHISQLLVDTLIADRLRRAPTAEGQRSPPA